MFRLKTHWGEKWELVAGPGGMLYGVWRGEAWGHLTEEHSRK